MILSEAIRQYQVALEAKRVDPLNEYLWEELLDAKKAMEVAWLESRYEWDGEED